MIGTVTSDSKVQFSSDGIGTSFANSGNGIVDGPGQANLDVALSLSKILAMKWPAPHGGLQFRVAFCHALNHPQFANLDTNCTSPTFGV
jgi:hypothetical protein